jgi:fido (protein-threonine AMPylation protein)
MSLNRDSSRTWNEVQRTGGLHPNITNIDEYNEQWDINQDLVDEYLENLSYNQQYLSSKDVIEIHRLSFQNLTDFGGETSKVQMQFGPHMGAPPSKMKEELQLLDRQMKGIWREAKDTAAKQRAIAFQHVRLVGIHCFQDGNGRTSRRALEFAFERTFDQMKNNVISREDYISANNSALNHGNIGRLANMFAQDHEMTYSGAELHIAPYETKSFQVEYDLTGDMGLARSSIQAIDSINEPSHKNRWLRRTDIDKILQATNGKPAMNFDDVAASYENKIKRPMSIAESIELIKEIKDSGAIKNKLFKSLHEEGYTDVAYQRLQGAVEYAGAKDQQAFKEIIKQQFAGKISARTTKDFLAEISYQSNSTNRAVDLQPHEPKAKKSLKAYSEKFKEKLSHNNSMNV